MRGKMREVEKGKREGWKGELEIRVKGVHE